MKVIGKLLSQLPSMENTTKKPTETGLLVPPFTQASLTV